MRQLRAKNNGGLNLTKVNGPPNYWDIGISAGNTPNINVPLHLVGLSNSGNVSKTLTSDFSAILGVPFSQYTEHVVSNNSDFNFEITAPNNKFIVLYVNALSGTHTKNIFLPNMIGTEDIVNGTAIEVVIDLNATNTVNVRNQANVILKAENPGSARTSQYTFIKTSGGWKLLTLGTMAQQNANSVAITGGTINGTKIGETNAETARFSQLKITNTTFGSPDRWVGLSPSGDFTSPAATPGMPISIGGTGATTPAGARTNLGLGSAAERDANAFTNRPLMINVSGGTTRNLLASESGAMVLMNNSAGNNIVNLPIEPPNGTYYWIWVIGGGSAEQIVNASEQGFAGNGSIDGISSVGSTGANFATMLVVYVAQYEVWHVIYNDGWTNTI
jgi:hypothetical protein